MDLPFRKRSIDQDQNNSLNQARETVSNRRDSASNPSDLKLQGKNSSDNTSVTRDNRRYSKVEELSDMSVLKERQAHGNDYLPSEHSNKIRPFHPNPALDDDISPRHPLATTTNLDSPNDDHYMNDVSPSASCNASQILMKSLMTSYNAGNVAFYENLHKKYFDKAKGAKESEQ